MSCFVDFFVGCGNVIEYQALKNSVTGVVDTGATVELTKIVDTAGATVTGQTFPLSMPHDAGGTYRATVSALLAIEAGSEYMAHIDATGSGGETDHREVTIRASYRGAAAL